MFEIEQKYHVDDLELLQRRLDQLGANELATQQHCDTYYNHPCRDFAETREALRVRRVDGVPMITYKGTKLPGAIKARRELEWRLDPGDADGNQMEQLLQMLGFRLVSQVHKSRRCFQLRGAPADVTVVIDDVLRLGAFAEIELIADDAAGVEPARQRIEQLGQQLGLRRAESRSYLRMILELDGAK